MGKKIVLHSVLVDNPDIEVPIFQKINANFTFVPNDDVELFFNEITDADGIVIADRKITPEIVKTLKKCKIIARQGIGYDNIDLFETKKRDIHVTNVPDYCQSEVSDFAMSLILTMARNIKTYDAHIRKGSWDVYSIQKIEKLPQMRRLSTQTLGIIGFGRIAQELIKKAKPFGFKIISTDPYGNKDLASKMGVELVSFDEVLKRSDIISIHCLLTAENTHMFNEQAFNKMKQNAILINTGRGPHVKEEDLYSALKNKVIAGAALDVLEREPIDEGSRLLELDNLIITPHAAFLTQDSLHELRRRSAEEVVRRLSGQKVQNRVNK